jgi:hypothetical protein
VLRQVEQPGAQLAEISRRRRWSGRGLERLRVAVQMLDRPLAGGQHPVQSDAERDVSGYRQVTLTGGLDNPAVRILGELVVHLDEVVSTALGEVDCCDRFLARDHRQVAVGPRRPAVDDRARYEDRGTQQLAGLDALTPQHVPRHPLRVPDRRDAVGDEQEQVVLRVRVTMHVGQPGYQVLAAAVDTLRSGWDLRFVLGSDPADPVAVHDHRLSVEQTLAVHRDYRDAFERSSHYDTVPVVYAAPGVLPSRGTPIALRPTVFAGKTGLACGIGRLLGTSRWQ